MDSATDAAADARTGLPGSPSWRSVYLLVLGILAVWVALLAALPWLFS